MNISVSGEDLTTFEKAVKKEWLLTNGIGGYASSTLIGMNTRKYHGLLVASIAPPAERYLFFSKIDEVLTTVNGEYPLSTNQYPNTIYPKGYKYLSKFTQKNNQVEFLYKSDEFTLSKTITMETDKNQTVITYKNLSHQKIKLDLTPFVSFRDYHSTRKKFEINISPRIDGFLIAYPSTGIIFFMEGRNFYSKEEWYYNIEYNEEYERGLDFSEDLFTPGYFSVYLGRMEEISISSSVPIDFTPEIIKEKTPEIKKVKPYSILYEASDAFIVKRQSTNSYAVIAGYHWFTDWGRDTMISLPGLTLIQGRFDIAKDILSSYLKTVKNGLVPNRFPDFGKEAEYGSVDATLWLFYALFKYYQYTEDKNFIAENYGVLKEIIQRHIKGTDFGLKMDTDCLLSFNSGSTWMDAFINNIPVTPRYGKAVEINALWYNALKTMIFFAQFLKTNEEEEIELISQIRESFNKFWNPDTKSLYDVIELSNNKTINDPSVRPNQIFALSLPFALLDNHKSALVLKKIEDNLLTPYGLRTLSPDDKQYKGIYSGDQFRRDSAYHQGTVWPWLIGSYITAYVKHHKRSRQARAHAKKLLNPLLEHMTSSGCIGFIPELFDANFPHTPKGTVAQAWSTAEVLRCLSEDIMNEMPL